MATGPRHGIPRSLPALVLLLGAAAAAPPAGADPVVFERIGDGVELGRLAGAGEPPFTGHAVRLDLEAVDVSVVRADGAARVAELAAGRPRHVAVNASFFDERGAAMGRVVSDGVQTGARRAGPWGALVIADRRARIVRGAALPDDAPGGDLVVQGLPRLVVGGEAVKLKPQVAERTAVCAAGRTLVLVVASRAEAGDFARLLAGDPTRGGLGCRDALNLDGGSSTQLSLRWGDASLHVSGAWGVPNALLAVPRAKPEAPADPD